MTEEASGASQGSPQEPEVPPDLSASSKMAPQHPEGSPDLSGSSKMAPQDPEGPSKMSPQDPEGSPDLSGTSKMSPQDPEGSPDLSGSSKMAPQDPEGPSKMSPQHPEGSPDLSASSKMSPQEPKGSPDLSTSSKMAPQAPQGSPQDPEGPSKVSPQDPEGSPDLSGSPKMAPRHPEGSPALSRSSEVASQEAVGPLRAALEAALRREPGDPHPPELRPLLGLPLPPQRKCRSLDAQRLLRDNLSLASDGGFEGLGALRTALSILEKYGRNLLQPRPPRHWRGVRFGNPVFRTTVGAVRGGREVLVLLGYTQPWGEGLSFPQDVGTPQAPRVARVTADVLLLRAELDLLLSNQHPNPRFFTELLQEPLGQEAGERGSAPQRPPSPTRDDPSSLPSKWPQGSVGHPNSSVGHPNSSVGHPNSSVGQPHGSMGQPPSSWACASCTFLNPGPSVLCGVCERPRLARRPPPAPQCPQGWPCPHCTFWNEGPGPTCSLCRGARAETPKPPSDPRRDPQVDEAERRRQQRLWEDGSRLVAIVRAAEAQGVPPEAVWVSVGPAVGPTVGQAVGQAVGRARAALGPALARLLEPTGRHWEEEEELGPLSLREAARAWIRAHGDPPRAKLAALGARRRQLRVLRALGLDGDAGAAAQSLFQNGGDVWAAAADQQRRSLQPLLRRLWQPQQPLDFQQHDQQALCRRVLASLDAGSWGRAALLCSLGRDLGLGQTEGPALAELLEAVRGCRDPEALRRRLRPECSVCGSPTARDQVLGLAWCQCPLCPECFRLHFSVAVREREGVGALVCPTCGRPDLSDEAQRLAYFATLDVQLRQHLDPNTYQLFTQKLTELELLRDPQFLWCPQCSFGFIFEAERGPAQCPQCQRLCCPRCRQPWDPAHASLSCSEFQSWLSARDPQPGAVGLAAFLQEQRLGCPGCGLALSVARGGCLHCRCPRCLQHFCSACQSPFYTKDSCPDGRCPLRGSLHGHHPRRCLFYLRDWEPSRLQQLLTEAGVPFETDPPPGVAAAPGGGCPVLEQKEALGGLRDEPCGRQTHAGHGGLCRSHYVEYLWRLVWLQGLDPLPLYDEAELLAAAERHLPGGRPPTGPPESPRGYRRRLRHLLQQQPH